MATYEHFVRETDRFHAVDTEGRRWTIIEQTTYKVRIGFVAKNHLPVELRKAYHLDQGATLLVRGRSEFQTQDGLTRLTRLSLAMNDHQDTPSKSIAGS